MSGVSGGSWVVRAVVSGVPVTRERQSKREHNAEVARGEGATSVAVRVNVRDKGGDDKGSKGRREI